jgi:hypothetical protein
MNDSLSGASKSPPVLSSEAARQVCLRNSVIGKSARCITRNGSLGSEDTHCFIAHNKIAAIVFLEKSEVYQNEVDRTESPARFSD